jgi:hypothetical protein
MIYLYRSSDGKKFQKDTKIFSNKLSLKDFIRLCRDLVIYDILYIEFATRIDLVIYDVRYIEFTTKMRRVDKNNFKLEYKFRTKSFDTYH